MNGIEILISSRQSDVISGHNNCAVMQQTVGGLMYFNNYCLATEERSLHWYKYFSMLQHGRLIHVLNDFYNILLPYKSSPAILAAADSDPPSSAT